MHHYRTPNQGLTKSSTTHSETLLNESDPILGGGPKPDSIAIIKMTNGESSTHLGSVLTTDGGLAMNTPNFFLGVDIAAATFTCSALHRDRGIIGTREFANALDGFQSLAQWLGEQEMTPANAVVCLEATGVYGEALCHFLAALGYRLALESPLKVKRAFHPAGRKTDAVDSRQIAEYASRFYDQLAFWQPPSEIVEQVRTLLALRERVTKTLVIHKNAHRSLLRKPKAMVFADQMTTDLIATLQQKIRAIDDEIERVIKQDSSLYQLVQRLDMIPGVGLLLAAYYLVMTNGFAAELRYRSQAAFLGIAPLERQSGTMTKRPHSRQYGPQHIRKLLHLAARSVCVHKKQFRQYYMRKREQGKAEAVIYNNVSNKLLRLLAAIAASGKPYIAEYRSVNPALLRAAA
jgi:transposase